MAKDDAAPAPAGFEVGRALRAAYGCHFTRKICEPGLAAHEGRE